MRYRAWHRGTRELDLLLGPFADAELERMDEAGLDRFEALLETEETELQSWLLNQATPPAHADRTLLDHIIAFRLTTR